MLRPLKNLTFSPVHGTYITSHVRLRFMFLLYILLLSCLFSLFFHVSSTTIQYSQIVFNKTQGNKRLMDMSISKQNDSIINTKRTLIIEEI